MHILMMNTNSPKMKSYRSSPERSKRFLLKWEKMSSAFQRKRAELKEQNEENYECHLRSNRHKWHREWLLRRFRIACIFLGTLRWGNTWTCQNDSSSGFETDNIPFYRTIKCLNELYNDINISCWKINVSHFLRSLKS